MSPRFASRHDYTVEDYHTVKATCTNHLCAMFLWCIGIAVCVLQFAATLYGIRWGNHPIVFAFYGAWIMINLIWATRMARREYNKYLGWKPTYLLLKSLFTLDA